MTVREALTHPWLTVRVQIALGAIFVAAALPKIADPPSFSGASHRTTAAPLNGVPVTLRGSVGSRGLGTRIDGR